MKNPLRKRQLRELKSQWKKYLVLFLLLTLTIGFVSGLFVANNSMETAAREAYEKYNIEDGHFILKEKPTEELLKTFDDEGITIYEQYLKDLDEDVDKDGIKDATIRVFKMREEVNRACLMQGEFPNEDNEIAIDRMHADNNGISVGDVIKVGGQEMKVVGLVAFSDYSTLYENSSDIMFDALTFNVGAVTPEYYEKIEGKETYEYAWQYLKRPADENEQKELSETLVEQLAVLSATGGMIDDEDSAKELEKLVDEAEALEDRADILEEKGDALKAEGDELEAEGSALEEEGDLLKADAKALQSDADKLMKDIGTALLMAGVPVTGDTSLQSGGDIPPELLAMLPEAQQKKVKDLQNRKTELENKGADLEKRGEDLKQRADDLQLRADELEAEGDALKDEFDALEDKLPSIVPGIESFEDLEKYEDHTNELLDFVPEYINQAIHFAPSDLGSDKAMAEVLLIVLVIVLAFIFAITVNDSIVKEAAVIGTLRSSGYTRNELLIHYVALPIIVTVLACILGNVLGYTMLKETVVGMYYNSYSLPTYVTLWNADGFIKTTVYPLIIMVLVCTVVVYTKLRIAPLKFLRRDLSLSKRKKAIRLPKWKFMTRFRIRILAQNIPDYLVVFAGIFFVMVMLAFSVGLPVTLDGYEKDITDYMLSDYQYILKSTEDNDGNPITTEEPTAEKFSMTGLLTVDGKHVGEDVSVYGYEENSKYFDLSKMTGDGVAITHAYADKFGISVGDTVTLKEEFGNGTYEFRIGSEYDLPGTVALILSNDEFNRIFENEEGDYTGYLSENEITDIEDRYIYTVVTKDDMLKLSKQLDHSMGAYVDYFSVICMLVAMLIMYLLTKMIIEKNAVSISMVKVLGYTNKEINSLYVRLTTVVVIVSSFATSFLGFMVVREVWKSVMYKLNGWFVFKMTPQMMVKMVILVIVPYLIIALADMRRIKKIPLTEALKNVE